MGMRVSQDAISTSALSQPGGADAAAVIGKGRRNPGTDAVKARRDSVNLSSLSERIAEAGRQSDTERTESVRRLAGLYTGGQYHVNAQDVSRAMVEEALDRSNIGRDSRE